MENDTNDTNSSNATQPSSSSTTQVPSSTVSAISCARFAKDCEGCFANNCRYCRTSPEDWSFINGEPPSIIDYACLSKTWQCDWSLQGSEGKYSFNPETCELDLGEGAVARFYCRPIQQEPLRPSSADAAIRAGASIQIKSSEIMREIQDEEENEGALFVLPSQLNGAEYTSHERRSIVEVVEEYKRDNTGGPRGQLAAHPAAAQFVIDNAANERQQEGINAVDQLLKVEGIKEVLELRNGYLEIKEPKDEELEKQVLALMDENLHSLRPLVMEDIPASGLTPNKGRRATDMQHKVGLVYASAVPVQAYMNKGPKAANRAFQECVARRILTAQYFGALKHAAEWASEKKLQRKVFLMPLGGGVFNNPWESICSSMANAMAMLSEQFPNAPELLDVYALAWNGNRAEEETLERFLKGS